MGYQRECIHVWLRSQDSGTKTTPSSNPVPTSRESPPPASRGGRQGFQPLGIPWLSFPSRTSCCSIHPALNCLISARNSHSFPCLFPFSLSPSKQQVLIVKLLSIVPPRLALACVQTRANRYTLHNSSHLLPLPSGLHLPSSTCCRCCCGPLLVCPFRLHLTILFSTSPFLFFQSSLLLCFLLSPIWQHPLPSSLSCPFVSNC
ncbi:hypothetical protein ASPBRDRAFT_460744 [Aspergillus brasiliensis CBS 101740]|uniref:Uncharacterized protein n=1 Tax=Aspergillus brasiliensis (strain CBS 101740 / IMI 381727 / IBT 21946) TaxID=767769 RepID=A0A1L9USX0_ASPBC|nr:hypothetical protein ASPBRDRAFT_460744 [Aspergillus brasiliensis CBS 101740]